MKNQKAESLARETKINNLLKRQEAIDNLAKYAKANGQKETAKRIQKMSLKVFEQALDIAIQNN